MNETDVIATLQTIFDDIFLEPPKLTRALAAKDVPEWDSLSHISLLVAVEKAFGVRFRVGEVETARNVGEFADLISKPTMIGYMNGLALTILVGQLPHNTAVIKETAPGGTSWVVDMWPTAFGQVPDVMTLEKWLDEI